MHKPIEIKICGLTCLDDAKAALDAGADFLGFVTYPRSPRAISPQKLRSLLDQLGGAARSVAIFVNEPARHVREVARDCGLYAAQIHGDERAEDFADMPVPVWRAVRLRGGAREPQPDTWFAVRYVVDAVVPGQYGGTGVPADWAAAARFAGKYPTMLAGGLTPENVADAIRRVKPAGVDVSSGVETAPGRKDHARIAQFIREVRKLWVEGREPDSV